ncbi:MAG TPA: sialidase family protein, partial [Gemmatimonadaceae bacterium]|nr:sialidase family protein [Gemmatimonadaceae bacterium]
MLRAAVALAVIVGPRAATAQDKGVTLAVEGRASANPSIAAQGQFVAIAWSAATASSMDVFAATSRDGGLTFSAPAQVNLVPGEARVNGELPPRIALVPRKGTTPEIVVVWTAKAATSTRLLSARSIDGGRTFSASKAVPGSEGEGSRGWESVAVDETGRVFVLWLDHREAAMPAGMHHQEPAAGATAAPPPKGDPTERAGLSKLYFSSLDGTHAVQITQSVCYCCKTSLVTAGKNVYGVWRHVYPGSQRDIAFAMSRDGGKTFSGPIRVSDDQWRIDGCPENGPAIAIDRSSRAHVVWPAPPDGKNESPLALFYAMSRDGQTFAKRVQIPSRGPASHAQIVIGVDGSPLVAWDEIVDGARRVEMARVRVDASGKTTFAAVQPPDAGPGQWYPVLAATPTNTV